MADPDETEVRPDPADRVRTPAPEATRPPADDFSVYFLNNIVLNSPGYDIHARKVWESMNEHPLLDRRRAIGAYLEDYTALYKAMNRERLPPSDHLQEIEQRLYPQIAQLENIRDSIQGCEPSAEAIADNFITERASKIDGVDRGDLDALREDIIAYESIEITPEATVNILRESWENNENLPNPVDHYTSMLEEKIAHYQSDAGGGLDPQTASARAAVDVRAQVDTDSGVPVHMVVDENHTYYQNDILQMGNWLRNESFIEQQTAEAASRGQTVSEAEVMADLNRFGYTIHRRSNLEQTTVKAHADPSLRVDPDAAPASPAPAPRDTAEATPPPATTVTLTETFPADVMALTEQVNEAYVYEFLGNAPTRTIDDYQFRTDADAKFNDLTDAVASGDPQAVLAAAHGLSDFIADGMEAREMAFLRENWDEIHPYFERVGETVGADDYERGLEVLRERHDDIVDATYDHRGGQLRELLRDMGSFTKLETLRESFADKTQDMEALARTNGIQLAGMEAPSASASSGAAPAPVAGDRTPAPAVGGGGGGGGGGGW